MNETQVLDLIFERLKGQPGVASLDYDSGNSRLVLIAEDGAVYRIELDHRGYVSRRKR